MAEKGAPYEKHNTNFIRCSGAVSAGGTVSARAGGRDAGLRREADVYKRQGVLRGRILHIRGTVQTGLAPVVQIFVHITRRVVCIAVQNGGKAVLKDRLQLAVGIIRDIRASRHVPLLCACLLYTSRCV